MKTVFIDGQEGTTGLQILDRLKGRGDLELIEIPDERRKDIETKTRFLNEADLVILCLPDQAAVESVGLISNPATKVIDASTAHRTRTDWVYGLPERDKKQREAIKQALRVSNPGCYATGFILLTYPLVHHDIMPVDYPVTVHGASGYSGGGKKLIRTYEDSDRLTPAYFSYRPYALGLEHKHVPEMQQWTGLTRPPLFTPSVGNFHSGMLVSVPLISKQLNGTVSAEKIHTMLADYYDAEPFVRVIPLESDTYLEDGFLSPTACNDTNRVDIFVFGHEDQVLLIARLDNLGKGASGAAVQNMNMMLNLNEGEGLS
ncbi:MAG: N-acetyl-gamma-glutamyl-phosphate reductase [Desulfobacterales bacterium]